MESRESNTEKGSTYEVAVKEVLEHLKAYFSIEGFDTAQPGYVYRGGSSGGVIKLDVVARDTDGKELFFSCKGWNSQAPSADHVGGLLLSCLENDAKGFLVSKLPVTANTNLLADARNIDTIVFQPATDSNPWHLEHRVNQTLSNHFLGMQEVAPCHVEFRKIVKEEPAMVDLIPNPTATIKISEIDASNISCQIEGCNMTMPCTSEEISNLRKAMDTGAWTNISISSSANYIASTGKETVRHFKFVGRVVSIEEKTKTECLIQFQMYGNPEISMIVL